MSKVLSMAESTHTAASNAPGLEYPRLGRSREWMREHPKATNWLVTGLYVLLHLPTLVMMPFTSELFGGQDYLWLTPVVLAAQAVLIWFRNWKPWLIFLLGMVTDAILIFGFYGAYGGMFLYFIAYVLGRRYGLWKALWFILGAMILTGLYFFSRTPQQLSELLSDEEQQELGATVDAGGNTIVSEVDLFTGLWAGLIITFLLSVLIAGIGHNIRRSARWEAAVREWAIETQQFAQARERNEIAREMHDVVAHSLSVMISLADGATSAIDRNPGQAKEVLGHAAATGRSALADMRRMIGVLRASDNTEFAPQPSEAGLPQLLENFRQAGLPVRFTASGEPLPESKTLQLTVYRIIQESLTNALRYAHNATEVAVLLEHGREKISITVSDDGQSQHPQTSLGAGQGISGMRERAALYGGTASAGPRYSASGHRIGWQVHVELPLQEENQS